MRGVATGGLRPGPEAAGRAPARPVPVATAPGAGDGRRARAAPPSERELERGVAPCASPLERAPSDRAFRRPLDGVCSEASAYYHRSAASRARTRRTGLMMMTRNRDAYRPR